MTNDNVPASAELCLGLRLLGWIWCIEVLPVSLPLLVFLTGMFIAIVSNYQSLGMHVIPFIVNSVAPRGSGLATRFIPVSFLTMRSSHIKDFSFGGLLCWLLSRVTLLLSMNYFKSLMRMNQTSRSIHERSIDSTTGRLMRRK